MNEETVEDVKIDVTIVIKTTFRWKINSINTFWYSERRCGGHIKILVGKWKPIGRFVQPTKIKLEFWLFEGMPWTLK